MARYRKKPVVVEAQQFRDGEPCPGVYGAFPNERNCLAALPEGSYPIRGPAVVTIQGRVVPISDGEWAIDEGDGMHYYPCAADVFERIYEDAPDGPGLAGPGGAKITEGA